MQTIILVLVNFVAIYFTVDNIKKTSAWRNTIDTKSFLTTLYAVGILMPLFEEALFRSVCKQYLEGVPFSDYINGLIFGLVHIHNYILHKNVYITIIQMLSTAYLGYYLVQFESFIYAYLVHCLYNISIVITSYFIVYYFYKNEWTAARLSSFNQTICYCPVTQDDMLNKENQKSKYIFIDRKNIPLDMLERIDKLAEFKNKNFSKLNKFINDDVLIISF